MKFLSGAAEGGEGSAALPFKRRPDRLLTRRISNLLLVAILSGTVAMIGGKLLFPPPEGIRMDRARGGFEIPTSPQVLPAPIASSSVQPSAVSAHRDYAVGMHEIRGLPPDTAPGAQLELWVAWDDAYTKRPQVQKLVRSVTLVRFIEPVTPEGPTVAVLSIPESAMRAVMYGDLYGSFSVALLQS